jgi:hypothetical protein
MVLDLSHRRVDPHPARCYRLGMRRALVLFLLLTSTAAIGLAGSACGGGGREGGAGPAREPLPPSTPATTPAAGVGAGGIGLGNFDGIFDAGPDARWVQVDAAAFAGKKVNGRLAPEVIQKVVRANFDPLRKCYEAGLGRNPKLQGRVAVKFVIDLDGHVASAADFGSDMPDREVVRCVVAEYGKLTFPKPEGGIVTVVYPINFNPGD